MIDEYGKIFEKEVGSLFEKEIAVYEPDKNLNIIQPLSHNCHEKCKCECTHDCYKSLGELMRKNLLFYCYGEDELVRKYNSTFITDLEKAIQLAYSSRLPKRDCKMDGLPSEVLLDAIIQVMYPKSTKLAVRTIFRQNDNNEIKGYDLTYFLKNNGHIAFLLGQAKMGLKAYCIRGILEDLKEKYNNIYLSKQIYFLADKPCEVNDEVREILDLINSVHYNNIEKNSERQAEDIIDFFKENNVDIWIPCLLAYGKSEVYGNKDELEDNIKAEMENLKNKFNKEFIFEGITPKLIFIFLPIENLEELRGKEGFYGGLR